MKAARTSSSTVVPRVPPRQPVPRVLPARVGFHARKLPRIPLALLAVILLAAGATGFHQYLEETETFHLRDIMLIGGDRVTKEQVVRHLDSEGYVIGEISLLHISPSNLKRKLATLPELRSVSVERLWPDQLIIDITEHQAAGIHVSGTGSHVYNEDGYLFAAADGRDFARIPGPFLTGLRDSSLKPGSTIPPGVLRQARAYDDAFGKAAPELHASLSEIRWEPRDGITLVFKGGTRVHCGELPPDQSGPMVEALLRGTGGPERFETARLLSSEHLVLGPTMALAPDGSTNPTQLARGE